MTRGYDRCAGDGTGGGTVSARGGFGAMTGLGSERTPVADGAVALLVPRQPNSVPYVAARTWRHRIAQLFPLDTPRPALAGRYWWGVVTVLVGAAASLGRVPRGPGVLNTIWAEDGSDFLTDVLNRGVVGSVFRPLNGYFVIGPRLLALPAGAVPVDWAPAVLSIEAALVTALMAVAVYVASRTYLRHPLARLIAAAPVVAAPVAENIAAAVSNNVATLQFAGVYTALWMVLWVPSRRTSRIVAAAVVIAVSFSTFLAVVLLPLALLRLYARRDTTSTVMAGGLLCGLIANVAALATHLTARPVIMPSRYNPGWALSMVVEWALPHAVFGYGISGNGAQAVDPPWLMWFAWPIVLVALAVAAFRLSRPQWKLAAILGIVALALVVGTIMQYGETELRYVVAPELMLFAAFAALLLPRPDRSRVRAWAPLVALSVGLALVLGFSYRTASPRTTQAPWVASVATARAACQDPHFGSVYVFPGDGHVLGVPSGTRLRAHPPPGFPVLIPCTRLD